LQVAVYPSKILDLLMTIRRRDWVLMDGTELRNWRKSLDLTQEQAAKEFDVTRATVQNWEYGITEVPRAVELASRQILRHWKQRPEFGPVTLVSTMVASAGQSDFLPLLRCERYANNEVALNALSERIGLQNLSSFFILDDTKSVIWSGPDLYEQCTKIIEVLKNGGGREP
jgi:transcriptional regulator with XRE-family HTH domain